jgi:hypothetical protein
MNHLVLDSSIMPKYLTSVSAEGHNSSWHIFSKPTFKRNVAKLVNLKKEIIPSHLMSNMTKEYKDYLKAYMHNAIRINFEIERPIKDHNYNFGRFSDYEMNQKENGFDGIFGLETIDSDIKYKDNKEDTCAVKIGDVYFSNTGEPLFSYSHEDTSNNFRLSFCIALHIGDYSCTKNKVSITGYLNSIKNTKSFKLITNERYRCGEYYYNIDESYETTYTDLTPGMKDPSVKDIILESVARQLDIWFANILDLNYGTYISYLL